MGKLMWNFLSLTLTSLSIALTPTSMAQARCAEVNSELTNQSISRAQRIPHACAVILLSHVAEQKRETAQYPVQAGVL